MNYGLFYLKKLMLKFMEVIGK